MTARDYAPLPPCALRVPPASSSASIFPALRGSAIRSGAGLPAGCRRSAAFAPNAFIRIGTDDTVTVLIKHIEFGQGPFTGLSTIVAEELDADWSQMRAEHAPSNPDLYKNLASSACRAPAARRPIANSCEQLRKAGATARAMLVRPPPQRWNVPAREITVERGVLRHAASGRKAGSAQFAEAAAQLPAPGDVPLKDPAAFRLIGREGTVKKLDSAGEGNGTAQFTIDIREPGMLTVVVARPPRFGGKVASFDAAEALAVPGVVDVKQVPSGVAVYAEGTWPACKGARELACRLGRVGCRKAQQRTAHRRVSRARAQAPGVVAGDAWRCRSGARARRARDRGGVRLPLSGARADGAARRLSCSGTASARRRASAASSRLANTGHRQRARTCPAKRGDRNHAGRRQLRPARRRPTHASRRRACAGGEGDRPGPAGQARVDARGRHPRRLLPPVCSCTACAAPCATARSSPGRTPSWASPS